MSHADDDLIWLAAWAIGAIGVGARGDGKSAIYELCSKIEEHPTLPRPVAARMVSDLHTAREEMSSGPGSVPECLCTAGIAIAAITDLTEDIRRCPLLREQTKALLLSELRPLRRDSPESLLAELVLMRRLAETALVLDCFEGVELSVAQHAFTDPLAKHSAVHELFKTVI